MLKPRAFQRLLTSLRPIMNLDVKFMNCWYECSEMRSDGHVVNRELFVDAATYRPGKLLDFQLTIYLDGKAQVEMSRLTK
ncbi:hypothetical protein BPOR_0144g00030 [Botrytis porri]|uniref:Uncharacterized protein n=1 Tax=Botrytis porri TaxID=87229 RepID=A0A4Z1KWB9_9HELO|nr:hypothetical protein BPOR_0144g00030 [Botrytis porri]